VSDPPRAAELDAARLWVRAFVRTRVRPWLAAELRREERLDPQHGRVQLVGTGGTATILARMQARLTGFQRGRIERARLTRAQVRAHTRKLWRLPLARRRRIPGLPPERADVILMGVLIYEAVMEEFGFPTLRVSTRGLRYAAVLDARSGLKPSA
jgi:exopolyphosphatase/guanosine-5'-triphosphate,3'-diphosphate pyrophosphatase